MISKTIDFDIVHEYDTFETGITLPIILKFGESLVKIDGKIDTGSTFCVFERIHGENLGIEIETGIALRIGTAAGSFPVFGHTINLSVLGIETESTVYFAAEESFSLNVLGRNGWLDRVKLGLIDYEGKLLLSDYGK